MYYHIVTDLESKFSTLDAALDAYTGVTLTPRVPSHKLDEENCLTPRLCVCKWLPDCLTAIGLRETFKRCLGGNDCIDPLDPNENEVYPVIILEFSEHTRTYKPDLDDVEDAAITNEEWILRPVIPDKVYVRWLNNRSILFKTNREGPVELQALSCNFVTDITGKNHPYLNGQGHTLKSLVHETQFEDYQNLPAGKYLGNIFTLPSTIEQITEMTGWKEIKGIHELRIKSENLPAACDLDNAHLEIICKAGDRSAPELYLELVSHYEHTNQPTVLAKSENFTDLSELQRTGVRYQNAVYRPRIYVIDANSTTGYIPVNPANMSNNNPDELQQIFLTTPEELAEQERNN